MLIKIKNPLKTEEEIRELSIQKKGDANIITKLILTIVSMSTKDFYDNEYSSTYAAPQLRYATQLTPKHSLLLAFPLNNIS